MTLSTQSWKQRYTLSKASLWSVQINRLVADVAINKHSTKPSLHRVQYATGVAVRTTSLKFADPVITNYLHQMSTPLNMTMYFMGTEDMFTGMIHMNCGLKDWKAAILLVNQKAIFKLDTGSSAMSFQKNTTKSVQSLWLPHARLMAFGSTPPTSCGKATIPCQHKDKPYAIEFVTVDQNVPKILGLKDVWKWIWHSMLMPLIMRPHTRLVRIVMCLKG